MDLGSYLTQNWPITIGLSGIIFWVMFILRAILANGYSVYTIPYWKPTAVVAVNYRESEAVVRKSIESVLSGLCKPELFLVVFNGKLLGYEYELIEEYADRITFLFLEEGDKRRAMAAGVRYVIQNHSEEIDHVVLMDGDTIWRDNTLEELIKPFVDSRIDAVAAAQNYLNSDESLWTHIQALYSHWGHNIGQKWQSKVFSSSCLRGRTNAFRLSVLSQPGFLEEFEDWYFCGNRRKSGDDGTLTFLTIKYNYLNKKKRGGTFVQMSSVVDTLAEPGWNKFWKMRVRCISNTHTRYLDAVIRPWFWRQHWRFKMELITSVIIPLFFFTCTIAFILAVAIGVREFIMGNRFSLIPPVAMYFWFMIGRFLRAPKWACSAIRISRWPAMIFVFLFPLVVVRWWALIVIFLPQKSWGSRTNETVAVSFDSISQENPEQDQSIKLKEFLTEAETESAFSVICIN